MQKYDVGSRNPGTYERWIEKEGVPVHEALIGVEDVAELKREAWPRTGGRGAIIQMLSLYQAEKGMYVIEIPPAKALNPERHIYAEFLFVLSGRGATEVWLGEGTRKSFEWGQGSVFSIPLNAWHRLINASSEPALVLGLTTAPRIMNTVHDADFAFNCDYRFANDYAGENDYFSRSKKYTRGGRSKSAIWETNFIANAYEFKLDPHSDPRSEKVAGGLGGNFHMGSGWPNGHFSQWPVGIYHKAHRHGPGAVIIGLNGTGYVLAWPQHFTSHPYENGFGDKVGRMSWGHRSVYAPPDNWYHQHFNTGKEPARHIAVHSGVDERPLLDFEGFQDVPVLVSEREGGLTIDYEDEDPEIRKAFEEELARNGVRSGMPAL
jgi:mannose-6-phosphate isomerase-like protein (cupin superfamily)